MARRNSRINPAFLTEQATKRKSLSTAPSQAGGLPAVNDRVQVIEEILSIHSYAIPAQP